jgi:TonB family protein
MCLEEKISDETYYCLENQAQISALCIEQLIEEWKSNTSQLYCEEELSIKLQSLFLKCRLSTLVFIIGLLISLVLVVQSQTEYGTVSGIIIDQQKARISDVTVTVKNLKNGYSCITTSDQTGFYSFDKLPIGKYEITVKADGFNNTTEIVNVSANRVILFNSCLTVNSIVEIIEVRPDKFELNEQQIDEKDLMDLTMRHNLTFFAINSRLPEYPQRAIDLGIEGEVFVGVIVNPDGKVHKVFFLKGKTVFSASILNNIKEWKFKTTTNGLLGYIRVRYSFLNARDDNFRVYQVEVIKQKITNK